MPPTATPPQRKTACRLDDDGKVYATYSNGERMLQGQVVLATFRMKNGLEAAPRGYKPGIRHPAGLAFPARGTCGTPLIGRARKL